MDKYLDKFLDWFLDAPLYQSIWLAPVVAILYSLAIAKNLITGEYKKQ